MKTAAFVLFYIFSFCILAGLFAPKENLYYWLENKLQNGHIVVTGEVPHDNMLRLSVDGGRVYYDDLHIADLNKTNFFSVLFYSRLDVSAFHFSNAINFMLPKEVQFIRITYSILNPLRAIVSSEGDFGTINGSIELKSKKIVLRLTPSKLIFERYQGLLAKFKKIDGLYVYEASF